MNDDQGRLRRLNQSWKQASGGDTASGAIQNDRSLIRAIARRKEAHGLASLSGREQYTQDSLEFLHGERLLHDEIHRQRLPVNRKN